MERRDEPYPRQSVVSDDDVGRWVRGLYPIDYRIPAPPHFGRLAFPGSSGPVADAWEAEYPRAGLGLFKPQPARRYRRRLMTFAAIREAAAELDADAVPRHSDGCYHVHLSQQTYSELVGDPEFQRLASGTSFFVDQPDRVHGELGRLQGLRFFVGSHLIDRVYGPNFFDRFQERIREVGVAMAARLNEQNALVLANIHASASRLAQSFSGAAAAIVAAKAEEVAARIRLLGPPTPPPTGVLGKDFDIAIADDLRGWPPAPDRCTCPGLARGVLLGRCLACGAPRSGPL